MREGQTLQIQQLAGLDGKPVETWMVTGEVVAVHIDTELLPEGSYDTTKAAPILRGDGPADYFEITKQALFKMYRPK